MNDRVQRIALALSVRVLLAAWVGTIEGHFQRTRRGQRDPQRASAMADKYDASWEEVAMDAPDGVPNRELHDLDGRRWSGIGNLIFPTLP